MLGKFSLHYFFKVAIQFFLMSIIKKHLKRERKGTLLCPVAEGADRVGRAAPRVAWGAQSGRRGQPGPALGLGGGPLGGGRRAPFRRFPVISVWRGSEPMGLSRPRVDLSGALGASLSVASFSVCFHFRGRHGPGLRFGGLGETQSSWGLCTASRAEG